MISQVLDRPREKSGSMKPAACDIRHQRSPTVRLEEYCMRSVRTHSRTLRAPFNCRCTAGKRSTWDQNSSSGVRSGRAG